VRKTGISGQHRDKAKKAVHRICATHFTSRTKVRLLQARQVGAAISLRTREGFGYQVPPELNRVEWTSSMSVSRSPRDAALCTDVTFKSDVITLDATRPQPGQQSFGLRSLPIPSSRGCAALITVF
jgi:hypothetical protein